MGRSPTFFVRADWAAFSTASLVVFVGYWFTLPPEVTLEYSGILATGAMYAGVPHQPGFPLWAIYAWVFTKAIPFSNVAWRVAFSSAVAGALACGIVAMIVSVGGKQLLRDLHGFSRLAPRKEDLLRSFCGGVAGLGFGFHRVFWGQAVIVETTALAMLLLSLVICLLLRWAMFPQQRRYYYGAVFVFGLLLTMQISLAAAGPGLVLLVFLRDRALGRDLLFGLAALLFTLWASEISGISIMLLADLAELGTMGFVYFWLAVGSAIFCVTGVMLTRQLLVHWRAVLFTGWLLGLTLSLYLFVPLSSMTNPPVNWSYSRTVEGFMHTLSRGQYERFQPTADLGTLLAQASRCVIQGVRDIGLAYVLAAFVPFWFMRKAGWQSRAWTLGLFATFLSLFLLTLTILNPPVDRGAMELVQRYFLGAHLVIVIFAGLGLVMLGTSLHGNRPHSV